jgi:hypothetical protein
MSVIGSSVDVVTTSGDILATHPVLRFASALDRALDKVADCDRCS